MSKQTISGRSARDGSPLAVDTGTHAVGTDGSSDDSPLFLPPLRPHRRLLTGTAAVLAVWLGFLLYLYFTTIYPHAGQARQIAPQPLPPSRLPPSGQAPGDVELLRPTTLPATAPTRVSPEGPFGPVGPIGPIPR